MADDYANPAMDADLIAALADGLLPTPLAARDRERLRTRILERAAGIHVVRADAGTWTTVLPGVSVKCLRRDDEARNETNLWRLAAGAVIPAHPHVADEECLVLEGSIEQDGIAYHAGDYLLAPAGSTHVPLSAPQGALLLIRSQTLSAYLAR